jgi:hypothetical protein
LTRQSIARKLSRRMMDARVKPAHDKSGQNQRSPT